jgi:hypothetical protein
LPREHYDLAVVRHAPMAPEAGQPIPCRVIFVYSSADAVICRQAREQDVERLRSGLERIAASVARGHPKSTPAGIARRVAELFGRRASSAGSWCR